MSSPTALRPLAAVAALAAALAAAPAHATTYTYVTEGTPLLYLRGTATPPPGWAAPGADESGWTAAATGFGIGYGDGDDRTVLGDMQNGYLTVYVRAHFVVGAEGSSLVQLGLTASFDDGFVAYLNGVEIGRASVPAGTLTAQTAAASHEVTAGDAVFAVDPSLLVAGDNVFAVEVHNTSLGSSDLSFIPALTASDAQGPAAQLTLGPYVQQVERKRLILCWETDVAAAGEVHYGPTPAYGLVATDPTVARRHEVPLTGLTPGTTYYYRVTSADGPGAASQTRTEGDGTTPLRVVAFGDTRTNATAHAQVAASILSAAPDLILHSGDLVESSTVTNWTTFFSLEAPLLSRYLLLPTIGNHEGDAVLYREKFVLPTDSPVGENAYVRRFAQVAVVTIDEFQSSYGAGSPQYGFVANTLAALAADPSIRFIFVQLHHGPYSSGSHGSNLTIRNDYGPLFEQYGVAIVFAGHDHDYERSTANGVKYVVTGGGGAPLYSVPGDTFTEAKSSTLHYCLMEIDGATLHFRALTPDSLTTIDEFWLGQGIAECSADADCEPRAPGSCTAPDQGTWRCVANACLWTCLAPPPQTDGGVPLGDGGLPGGDGGTVTGDGGPPAGDAATAGDAAPGADAGAPRASGGCACAAGGATPGAPPAAALLVALAALLRSRRRRRA